jgi:hypothetical protein
MRDACKKFGISDVALAKICRRMSVPRPRQGYWLRRSIGQDPPRKPLPTAGPDTPSRWEGERWVDPEPLPAPATPEPPAIAVDPIVVGAVLGKLHPGLSVAMDAVREASKAIWEFRRWRRTVPVLASYASLDRALRIMNTLMHALDDRGWRVEVRMERSGGPDGTRFRRAATGVHIGDAFVEFYLVERTTMVRLEPLPKLRRPETTEESVARLLRRSVEYRPNGQLSIEVDPEYGAAVAWTDKKGRRLEDCLHEVVVGIAAEADRMHARRLEHAHNAEKARQLAEGREQARREAEQRRLEAEDRRRDEEEKVTKLRATLADWREVRDVRAFIAEARSIVAAGGHAIEEGSTLDEFIRWATSRVERIDPFRVLWRDASEPPAAPSEARSAVDS